MPGGRSGLFPGVEKLHQSAEYKQREAEDELLRSVGRDHLLELAQAEKDGRLWMLAVLPQGKPVGQNVVYVINDDEICDDFVVGVQIGIASNGELCCLYETYYGSDFYAADIGKTIFLTYEAAEAALEKRGLACES